MRKNLNKFLAVFVSFVMAITMIPLNGFVSHAEESVIEVGDASSVTTVYEKVSDPSKLEDGSEVIIASGTNALKADEKGIGKDTITIANDVVSSAPKGTVWKASGSNGKYTFENIDLTENNKLNLATDSVSIGSGNELNVNSSGQIYISSGSSSWNSTYLYYNNSNFTVSSFLYATQFTFYKKINRAQLTINYYYDDQTEPVTKNVVLGEEVDVTNDFPGDNNDYSFENMIYNETKTTSKKIKVNGNAEITVYYKYKLDPDDKLYSDDETNEGDIPEYPAKGSVRINKTATSDDFNGTGVAKVELSTTGVPVKKGVDIVLLFDVSTSMNDKISSSSQETKLAEAKKSAQSFVEKVLTNSDGTYSNNRIALVTFAGYSGINGEQHLYGEEGLGNDVIYSLKNATKKADIIGTIGGWKESELDEGKNSIIQQGITNFGTDYTYAFKKANDILEESDPNRDKYIVFMTDGAPSNYNDVSNHNNIEGLVNYANNNDLEGAETAKENSKTKVYSIGFGMDFGEQDNNGFSTTQAANVLKKISSGANDYYINATNETLLQEAFDKIAASIKKAGTEAAVTDIIGGAFELQTTKTLPNNKGELSYDPTITVTAYDTYTYADYTAGKCNMDDIGTRKDSKRVLETVTFSEDGTEAYSDKIDNGNTNILNNGVITASTFTYTVSTKTFVWTIGDITEQDIALSYYVYLKGSMEGQRGDGLYDTNEKATITYTNYLGNNVTREFTKPKMPWGSAVVNYEFYLVNEKGQPVNSKGEEIPFENRVKINGVKQVKFNWNSDKKVEATVAAKDLVPKGYSLHIEDATYTVMAVSSGNGSHKITGTIPSDIEGAIDSTKMYSADAQYINSSVAFGVLNKTTLIPDTVVLDYGKSIDIDVMGNDRVQNAVLHSVAPNNTEVGVQLGDGSTDKLVGGFESEVTLTNGKAKVENGKVVYTPTKYMDSIDKFLYSAKVTTSSTVEGAADIDYYRYQTVSVIPATTVYYEDNFGSDNPDGTNGIVYSGAWTTEGTSSNSKQDNYIEGEDLYGYDSSYIGDNKLSGGSAKVVVGTPNANTTASFKFKGTGFDLISRTNSTSTKIVVDVIDKEGNLIKSKVLNNLYQSGDLYQIPVYKVHDLEYGEYTVTITVGASSSVGEGANFYLDAIRIYDPLGEDMSENEDFDEANIQYKADKEAYASITELRTLLIKADSFTEGQTLTNAAVYIDKTEDVYEVATYENGGPNNEVYLKKGQSIAFKLKTTGDPASIQIGAKAPNGATQFEFGSNYGIDPRIDVNTATDMYYDVTNTIKFITNDDGSKEGIVVISNTGELDNIISLTNIKITYNEPKAVKAIYSVDDVTIEESLQIASFRMEAPVETPDDNPPVETPDDNPSQDDAQSDILESIINTINTIKQWLSKWFS